MNNNQYLKNTIMNMTFWRRLAMFVLLVLIIIRPSLPGGKSPRKDLNLNIWFVVDATGSMVAKDVDGGSTRRYEKAASDIQTIVEQIPGAKYGLILQDYYSYVASPISSNADAIISASGYLKPKNSLSAQPTNLSDLLEYTNEAIRKRHERHPERIDAVVFMSDGEDYSGTTTKVPGGLTNLVKNGVVLGYGSEEGTIVEKVGVYDTDFRNSKTNEINTTEFWRYYGVNGEYETDSEKRVISRINESNLQSIASSINGKYYHRESGEAPSDVIDVLKKGSSLIDNETVLEVNSRKEIYWILALILLVLLLWEGMAILNRVLEEREGKHA